MARENTPDLLESMFAKSAERTQEQPKTTPKQRARQVRAKATPPPPPVVEPPIRATHYVSRETSSRMAAAQGILLGQTSMQKRELSNSNFVEAALRMALDDLEKNGVHSDFAQRLQQLAQEAKSS